MQYYSFSTEYGERDELFKAIMDADNGAYSRLKESGAVLSDEVKRALTHSTGTRAKPKEGHHIAIAFEGTIQRALIDGRLDYFVSTLRAMRREVGEPLYFSNSAYWDCTDNFYDSAVFECILDCFDNKKINKKQNMIHAIDNDRFDLLEIAIAHDWLKMPRKRDEIIAYAESKGKTEVVAYLLDFKNRTADLAAERARAEKKAERELNADPFSVTELKKLWKYEKQTDGTIMITGYKGNALEIAVPARIGKAPVTAVGERAFSPNALRITEEQALVRCRITKITVPEGVRTIGKEAFGGAGACCAVKGFFNAFSDLREVVLPGSLEAFSSREAAENAPRVFVNCRLLTVKVPHTPYAEVFCESQNVDFEFYNV